MSVDVESHLRAVERAVSSPERDGRSLHAVVLARTYATTCRDVWQALTNPDRLPRWFLPVSGGRERGGRYQLEGNAGGVITECQAPSHLALTWELGADVSWVEVRLSSDGPAGARLTLAHTADDSAHWVEYGPGATGVGWELSLLGLALHLARPRDPKLDEDAFVASPEGRAFIVGSSERWAQASIDSGTGIEAARAAARRTTAFYTGEPVEPR